MATKKSTKGINPSIKSLKATPGGKADVRPMPKKSLKKGGK